MSAQNRWIQEPRQGTARPSCRSRQPAPRGRRTSPIPRSTRAVLPPPLTAPPEPRVRVHFTRIEVNGHLHEIVGSFLLDAMYGDTLGQFCAVMPIDLETAVTPSRETYGEPKKLAQMECEREGDHIRASVTRQGVTIIEVVGDVTEKLAGAGALRGACSSGTSSCPRCRVRASTPDRSSSRCTRR